MQSFDTNALSMKYVGNTEKVSILFSFGGGLYVLKKIAFAIIFCFTCVYLSYHVAVISLLYIGRIDGFVYVQLLNIVVLH